MVPRRMLLGLTAILLLLVLGTMYLYENQRTESPGRTATERLWLKRIRSKGVEPSVAELLREVKGVPETEAHNISHAFGGALYEANAPLTACPVADIADEFLSSGCYHEYIGRGITDHGISFVDEVQKSCATLPSRELYLCEHGIGHGLVGYFGYTLTDLMSALDACTSAKSMNCYRGAFMEFDFRRLVHGVIESRPFDSAHGEPEKSLCDKVQEPARSVCIFWQPNWWYEELKHATTTPSAQFSRMQRLCTRWTGSDRHLCEAGVGFTLFYVPNSTTGSTRKLCDSVFKGDTVFCRIGAAARFRTVGSGDAEAMNICTGLGDADFAQCSYAARGKLWLLSEFPSGVIW